MRAISKSIKVTIKKGFLVWLTVACASTCMVRSGAAAADDRPGVSDKEIVIGSCCALTGPAKELGLQQLTGAKAYFNYINDSGGINGRKLKLNEYDDKYEPETAIVAFKKLVADKCFAAAFFVGTPTGAKHVAMAESHQVPLVGMFTGGEILRDPLHPHVFHVRASYFEETQAQIDKLFKDTGKKRIGVIYQDDAFGAAVLNGYKKALAKYGTEPVAVGAFKRNTTNVDEAIKIVRAAHPDFVGMAGQYTSLAALVKRSHELGWKPVFGTVSFVGTNAFMSAAGKDGNGVVISQVVPAAYRDKQLQTIALYKAQMHKYYPNEAPGYSSLEGFIDAMVLVDGLKRAGKDLTRTKFIEALETTKDLDLGIGSEFKITYSPTRHTGFDTVLLTVVKNGQAMEFQDWKPIMGRR